MSYIRPKVDGYAPKSTDSSLDQSERIRMRTLFCHLIPSDCRCSFRDLKTLDKDLIRRKTLHAYVDWQMQGPLLHLRLQSDSGVTALPSSVLSSRSKFSLCGGRRRNGTSRLVAKMEGGRDGARLLNPLDRGVQNATYQSGIASTMYCNQNCIMFA